MMGRASIWLFLYSALQLLKWVYNRLSSRRQSYHLTEARAYYIFACCSFFLLGEPAIVVKPTTNTNSHKYSSWKDVSSLLRVSVPLLPIQKRNDLSAVAQVWLRLHHNEQVFFTKRSSATFHMSAFLMTTRPFRGTLCGCSFTSCPGHFAAAVLRPAAAPVALATLWEVRVAPHSWFSINLETIMSRERRGRAG